MSTTCGHCKIHLAIEVSVENSRSMSEPVQPTEKRRAIYAGSFDPVTNGHLWVIEKGARLFDELVIAIGENPSKNYMFSVEERVAMLSETLTEYENVNLRVIGNKYLVKYAAEQKISYLLRGIRSVQDFEYEKSMAQINHDLVADIETVYLLPPASISQISSSMVKGLVGPDEWEESLKKYVPQAVLGRLRANQ